MGEGAYCVLRAAYFEVHGTARLVSAHGSEAFFWPRSIFGHAKHCQLYGLPKRCVRVPAHMHRAARQPLASGARQYHATLPESAILSSRKSSTRKPGFYRPSLVRRQCLRLALYRILFPVLNLIHCGIGRFCRCFFASVLRAQRRPRGEVVAMLAFWNRNEESPFAAFSPREVGGGAPHRAGEGEGHDSNNKNAIIIIIIFIVDGPLRAKSFVGRH